MTSVRRSLLALGGASAVWLAVACLDVSSPIAGITSISPILAPTPSVVEHDTLRDTAGVVGLLRVYAFGPSGDTVRDAVVHFYVVDTTNKLHVDSLTGIVSGDTPSPTGAVFARVWPANGKGFIDTPLDTIPVVAVPNSAVSDTNFTFAFSAGTSSDTNTTGLISPPFGVVVKGSADTTIQKYVVGFELVRTPASNGSNAGPTAVLTSALSTTDTAYAITDALGRATVRLRLRKTALSGQVLGGATDTAVVRFHVRYRGNPLPVTPADSIIITVHVT